MNRRNLETATHRAAEDAVAAELARAWGGTVIKMPSHAAIDRMHFVGRTLRAVVEIKCRTHLRSTYPTLMLSAEKWTLVRFFAQLAGDDVGGLLVVRFADGAIYLADLDCVMPVAVDPAVYADHADPDEVEPCVFLPVDEMKPLESTP